MEHIGRRLKKDFKFQKRSTQLEATIDEIAKSIPLTKKYGRGFWRRWVSKAKVSFGEMLGILKQLESLDEKKYNKGATLFNKLKKLCTKRINIKSPTRATIQRTLFQNGSPKK